MTPSQYQNITQNGVQIRSNYTGCVTLYNYKGHAERKVTPNYYLLRSHLWEWEQRRRNLHIPLNLRTLLGASGVVSVSWLSPTFQTAVRRVWAHIIPFCLVTCASHWGPELILFAERCHLEFAMMVSRSVAENGLATLQWAILSARKPARHRSEGLGPWETQSPRNRRGLYHCWCCCLHVDHQKMVPFLIFGVLSAGSIRICVKTKVYSLPGSRPSHAILVGRFFTWVGVSTLPSSDVHRGVFDLHPLVHFQQAQGPGPLAWVYLLCAAERSDSRDQVHTGQQHPLEEIGKLEKHS